MCNWMPGHYPCKHAGPDAKYDSGKAASNHESHVPHVTVDAIAQIRWFFICVHACACVPTMYKQVKM